MAPDSSWFIAWHHGPPGWATVSQPETAASLTVSVRVARTVDGLGVEAVLIERNDGSAVTARDLRTVKLPPAWMLASSREFMSPGDDSPLITAARRGARSKGDDHWRAVYDLLSQAQRVAPRAPVRWMRAWWPDAVSDATMRRWVKRANERAQVNGWAEEAEQSPRQVHLGAGRRRSQSGDRPAADPSACLPAT